MRVPILPPDLGEHAKLSLWCAKPGDDVRRGDRIAEATIPGLLADILAPVAGILAERAVNVGEPLPNDRPLGFIESGSA